jgi:hypothetical protein
MIFDELLKQDEEEREQIRKEAAAANPPGFDMWGTCPECHRMTAEVEVGGTSFRYCRKHKTIWRGGPARWKQSKVQQRRVWKNTGLDSFRLVQGWLVGMKAGALIFSSRPDKRRKGICH